MRYKINQLHDPRGYSDEVVDTQFPGVEGYVGPIPIAPKPLSYSQDLPLFDQNLALDIGEKDPNGLVAGEPGAKLDHGKIDCSLLEDFGLALLAVAEVATFGSKKYSISGWLKVSNGTQRYGSAGLRHLLKKKYEEFDKDSGLLHASHEAWNALAKLELILRDDPETKKRLLK